MKKILLNYVIDTMLFLYILSLYLLTYREGHHILSNALAFGLVISIWSKIILSRRKIIFNKFLLFFLVFNVLSAISVFYALDPSLKFI